MAKIIKMKDLLNETDLWGKRKFGEKLPTLADYKKAYNKKNINEAPPEQKAKQGQPPEGGQESEPKKLKIDIPDSPFNPDASQIRDKLKHVLYTWQKKPYPNDVVRSREYFQDILKLYKQLGGDE